MPRGPRDDAPGTAHHIMLRGIDRLPIFYDDTDREEFLRRLSKLVVELGFLCFAWVLMPNHVHLVLRSARARISRLMARLGTGYARYFNERQARVGHVFQNRFRSRRVVDDADLMGLVLYVARNPLEAGLVADAAGLERFRWGSLAALLGRRPAWHFEAVAETLALFDDDPTRAQGRLRTRLDAPEPAEGMPTYVCQERAVPARPVGAGFDALVGEICARSGLTSDQLRSRGRSPRLAAARAIVVSRAAQELGLSGAQIARRLGLSKQAVSVLLARGAAGECPGAC
jgi:REP element-mobilizing transposase RayT